MALLVTADEMRRMEADAVKRGATWEGLMEVAGRRIADATLDWLGRATAQCVLVLSGPGNNGGDGLVVARHLSRNGWQIRCLTWQRPLEGDDRLRRPLQTLGVSLSALEPG